MFQTLRQALEAVDHGPYPRDVPLCVALCKVLEVVFRDGLLGSRLQRSGRDARSSKIVEGNDKGASAKQHNITACRIKTAVDGGAGKHHGSHVDRSS
jgi:hypothetical protein